MRFLHRMRQYRLPIGLATLGYVIACVVVLVTSPRRWLDVTNAYVLVVTLAVLSWYAHLTKTIAETGITLREEANKPFVVLERVTDPDRSGYFHYAVHNVGPGIAVNVFHVVPASVTERPDVRSIGALAPGASRVLPGELNQALCDARGDCRPVVVIAEGIYTRTGGDRWMCTLNALTPTGEVLHRIRWTSTRRKSIDDVLEQRWAETYRSVLELVERAKGLG